MSGGMYVTEGPKFFMGPTKLDLGDVRGEDLEEFDTRGDVSGDWYDCDRESQGMLGEVVGDLFPAMNGIEAAGELPEEVRSKDEER